MGRWRMTDPGVPDQWSASGYAAPSWHSFKRQEWQRDLEGGGSHTLVLRNLHVRKPRKIATYNVKLSDERGKVLFETTAHNWQDMVRRARAFSKQHERDGG